MKIYTLIHLHGDNSQNSFVYRTKSFLSYDKAFQAMKDWYNIEINIAINSYANEDGHSNMWIDYAIDNKNAEVCVYPCGLNCTNVYILNSFEIIETELEE